MSKARLVVTAVLVEGRSKAEVARVYGMSRRWVGEFVHRFQTEGEAGLEPRSRRPLTSPTQVDVEIEDEIVRLRKQLEDAGLDAGAATIATHLHRAGVDQVPAVSTVWRILTRRGLVTPQPQKRPKSSFTRFEADQPNQMWQADITHWPLADGTDIEIPNILDDHSRLAIASIALRVFKAADVVDVFLSGFDRHGLPAAVLTDNGAVFAGGPRGGRVLLEKHCDTLGIRVTHSRPCHPQACGKVERFHQILKKRLRAQEPAETLEGLQRQLDDFLEIEEAGELLGLWPHLGLRGRQAGRDPEDPPERAPTSPWPDSDRSWA